MQTMLYFWQKKIIVILFILFDDKPQYNFTYKTSIFIYFRIYFYGVCYNMWMQKAFSHIRLILKMKNFVQLFFYFYWVIYMLVLLLVIRSSNKFKQVSKCSIRVSVADHALKNNLLFSTGKWLSILYHLHSN